MYCGDCGREITDEEDDLLSGFCQECGSHEVVGVGMESLIDDDEEDAEE
jgi:Zn finger protein HypA/HybF involved in hydrogenase expression